MSERTVNDCANRGDAPSRSRFSTSDPRSLHRRHIAGRWPFRPADTKPTIRQLSTRWHESRRQDQALACRRGVPRTRRNLTSRALPMRACRSAAASAGGQRIAEQIKMADVPGGLVNHVDEDPAEVDRSAPERRDRRNMVQRFASSGRSATAIAGRNVQPDDPSNGVPGVSRIEWSGSGYTGWASAMVQPCTAGRLDVGRRG